MKKITVEELSKIIDKLLETTHSLAQSHPKADKDKYFVRVMEGTFRRNTFTLLAIRHLMIVPELADSTVVLNRKMTEDVISIEFMLLEGKEEMAKRFYDFSYIQAYQEMELRKKLKYDIPEVSQFFLDKLEELKPQFLHKNGPELSQSWSDKNLEQMLEKIAKQKVFTKHEKRQVILAYTLGSWKNHPNPIDMLSYMENKSRREDNKRSLSQAAVLSIMCFIRLTNRYIDELRVIRQKNVYKKVAKVVKEIFDNLNSDEYGPDPVKK